ncbi:hypothetical protein CNR22_07695 [Sphingobacteriaceae bacterium]|nr:hypothetical protein CNR22_07695 [Sphingobacteriaceae bacterium]
MIWHTLRYLITFLLPVFYKRTQIKNLDAITVKGPVIIAMNHPNAFTDPIYIAYLSYPQRVFYMARGDAFKPGLIAYILEKIGIVPIFRIQDGGKEGLKKNDEAYRRVNHLLSKNGKVIVFAEGLCIQERRLRPVKKGVARMVFGAYEALKTENLVVVPIGVNYTKPDKFRSDIFYNIGEPIVVKDFMADYEENPARTYNKFLQVLEPKMKELITHINDKQNDEFVLQVELLYKKDLLREQGLDFRNLDHDFQVLKQLTEKVNLANEANPELVTEARVLSKHYFKVLEQNKLKDWLINPKQNQQVNSLFLVLRILALLLTLPLYIAGLLGNYLPLISTHLLAKKVIKFKEFYSSIAIGSSMFIFWINYVLWFMLIYWLSPNVLWPFGMCFVMIMCGYFSLYYHPFLKKTLGIKRILSNKSLYSSLTEERKKLLSLINKF